LPAYVLLILPELFAGQPVGARQFIDAIVGDRPAEPTFYDGPQTQAVIDAIEAHRSERWVEVP
jgi:hypothetical protein